MKNNSVHATPLPARYSSLVNSPGVVTPDGRLKKGERIIANMSSHQVIETGDSDSKRTTGFGVDKDTLPQIV